MGATRNHSPECPVPAKHLAQRPPGITGDEQQSFSQREIQIQSREIKPCHILYQPTPGHAFSLLDTMQVDQRQPRIVLPRRLVQQEVTQVEVAMIQAPAMKPTGDLGNTADQPATSCRGDLLPIAATEEFLETDRRGNFTSDQE